MRIILSHRGFNDYAVDEKGIVWSKRPGAYNKQRPWRKLKPSANGRTGHLQIGLYKRQGHQQFFYVHRLVLEAFVGPCPKGKQARHFPDRDPTNNNLCNLSWTTPLKNQRDRFRHGTSNRGKTWKWRKT